MQTYQDWTKLPKLEKPVVTIGVFDGVHLGHKLLFQKVKEISKNIRGSPLVFTFDRNPLEVLKPEAAPTKLVNLEKRISLIGQSGINTLLVQQFDPDFAKLSAAEFVEKVLLEQFEVHSLVLGKDFRFGNERQGDLNFLKKYSEKGYFELVEVSFLEEKGQRVSSTKIRQLLKEGQTDQASQLLGWDYQKYLNNLI